MDREAREVVDMDSGDELERARVETGGKNVMDDNHYHDTHEII